MRFEMNANMNVMGNALLNGPGGFQQGIPNLVGGNPMVLNMNRPQLNQNIMDVQMQRMGPMNANDPSMQMVCNISCCFFLIKILFLFMITLLKIVIDYFIIILNIIYLL